MSYEKPQVMVTSSISKDVAVVMCASQNKCNGPKDKKPVTAE